MRRGRVFRRCTSCHRRVKGRRCVCGHGQATWAFVVDLNPPGEPRRQKMGSGFQSEADATAAMNRLQADRAEGLYVEPRKLTVTAYLRDWIKNLEAPRDPGEEADAPGE